MPPVIKAGEITLKVLRLRDRSAWEEVRRVNRDWLRPWEATRPLIDSDPPLPSYFSMVRQAKADARELRALSLGIWVTTGEKSRFVGQITLGGLAFGAHRGGYIGYWIDRRVANQGIITRAVIALTDYGFKELSLHRIEINMRPENSASQRVAEKAGYTYEGVRQQFLHIDGDWRDHLIFVKLNPEIR
jgi:[ribosomal protein S5]-alanine N-acetyltransferase